MDGPSLCPQANAGAWLHQSLGGSTGHEPSLPLGITSRLAGIRGGPHGAVSDVCDPTRRLTSFTAFRLAKFATLYGSQPDAGSTQGVSPDKVDSICWAMSPPTNLWIMPGEFGSRAWGRVPGCHDPPPAASSSRAWLRLGAAFLATGSRLPLHVQGRVVPRRLGRGELGGGTLDVYLSYTFIDNMYVMKFIQFLNHIGWILASGMIKPRIAGHHLEGNPSKPPGHLHMDAAGSLP